MLKPGEGSLLIKAGGIELEAVLSTAGTPHAVIILLTASALAEESVEAVRLKDRSIEAGWSVLRVGLFSAEEAAMPEDAAVRRFDIPLLAERAASVLDELKGLLPTAAKIGLVGTGTAATAARVAATKRPSRVSAVVSVSGRPDLAVYALPRLVAPALLIVGEQDERGIHLNSIGATHIPEQHELHLLPGAGSTLTEAEAETVASRAISWLRPHLSPASTADAAAGAIAGSLHAPTEA